MSRQSDGLQRAPLSVNELISLGALGNQSINLSDKVAFVVSTATNEVQRTKSQLRRTQGELNVALQQLDSTKKILSKVRIARDKEKTQVHLMEAGPRFEMRLYQIKLGTIEQTEVETEFVLRTYQNSAKRRKTMGE